MKDGEAWAREAALEPQMRVQAAGIDNIDNERESDGGKWVLMMYLHSRQGG